MSTNETKKQLKEMGETQRVIGEDRKKLAEVLLRGYDERSRADIEESIKLVHGTASYTRFRKKVIELMAYAYLSGSGAGPWKRLKRVKKA